MNATTATTTANATATTTANDYATVHLSAPIITDFVLYSALMIAIGLYFWRKNNSAQDYFLGARSMGPVVSALSAGASDMSGWLLMGLPGAVLAAGLGQSLIAIGLSCGALLNWLLVAKRLRSYAERERECITIADYLQARFGASYALRIICAVVILVFFTIYISSALVAGAKLFESLFGVRYMHALAAGTVLIVAYTFTGGYKAVCWTDLIQGLLMMSALVIIPAVMLAHIGGLGAAADAIASASAAAGRDFASLGGDLSAVAVISALAWGLGYFGQPHILVRFMSIRSVREIPTATAVGISWMVISLAGAVAVGFLGIAYLHARGEALADPERIFIAMSQQLFNPWIAGVLLSAILAAIMSTASSQLLVSSSTLAEDFYRKILRPDASPAALMRIARASVLAVAAVAFFISTDQNASILNIVSYAWAGFGASFGSVILLSLFWPRMSRAGAIAGMSAGAAMVLAWENLGVFGIAREGIWAIYSILPGFGAAVCAIVAASVIWPNRRENARES